MALSGRISKAITGRTYYIDWTATQNYDANTSTITCNHYLKNDSSYSLKISSRDNTCNVGGVVMGFHSASINTGGGTTHHLGTTTHTLTHNTDGTLTTSIQGVFNIKATLSGKYVASITASGSITLDVIPHPATIQTAADFNDEGNPTITYSNIAGEIMDGLAACISLDGNVSNIEYRDIGKTSSSYTFNLTEAERNVLRNATTTSNSRDVWFIIRSTIAGKNYYTSLKKTLSIVNANPVVSAQIVDINPSTLDITQNANSLIRYQSNASITINATPQKGATIQSYKAMNGSKTITAATGTIEAVETNEFKIVVVDSRGNTTTIIKTANIINYINLTCNIDNNVPDASGNYDFRVSGNYFNDTFGGARNVLNVMYRFKPSGGEYGNWIALNPSYSGNTYYATANITGLDYRTTYIFQAYVVDRLIAINTDEVAVKSMPIFDWGEEDFNFNVPVSFNGLMMDDMVVEQGADSGGIYRKWKSGLAEYFAFETVNTAIDTAYGNVFYNGSVLTKYYPIEFTGTPFVFISCQASNAQIYYASIANANERECSYYLSAGQTIGDANVLVRFHIIGHYK